MLSEVAASQSDAVTPSKDPAQLCCDHRRKKDFSAHTPRWERELQVLQSIPHIATRVLLGTPTLTLLPRKGRRPSISTGTIDARGSRELTRSLNILMIDAEREGRLQSAERAVPT